MTANAQPTPHFTGCRLTIARVVWIIAAVLYIGTYLAAGQVYLRQATDAFLIDMPTAHWTAEEFQSALAQFGLTSETFARLLAWLVFLGGSPFWMVAVFIFWRKSSDRTAFLIATCFILLGAAPAVFKIALEPLAQADPVWQFALDALSMPVLICLPLIFYIFPGGQFEPRWTRWTYAIWLGYFGLTTVGPPAVRSSIDGVIGQLTLLGLFASLPIAQVYRYLRISNLQERQQIKWIVFGLSFGVFCVLAITSSGLIFPALRQPGPIGLIYSFMTGYVQWSIFLLSLPLSFAIAILRSRLWDIDLIIRRTLQYSVLSGLLALTYFGLIIVLQSLFTSVSGQSSPVITVLSTLAIAALSLPLRRRVQDFIDKRFYRRKYDAAKVIADFAATCRDETDLDNLTARLVEVVEETMQPESVTLWLQKTSPSNPHSYWERGNGAEGSGGGVDS